MKKLISLLLVLVLVAQAIPAIPSIALSSSSGWDGSIANEYHGDGDGSMGNPYQIATAEQLARMADRINGGHEMSQYYTLVNDIDIGGYEWTPIGDSFNPNSLYFDGNNYTVRNMQITDGQTSASELIVSFDAGFLFAESFSLRSEASLDEPYELSEEERLEIIENLVLQIEGMMTVHKVSSAMARTFSFRTNQMDYVGLFGYVPWGSIENVVVEDADIYGGQYTGGVVGYGGAGLTIENCYISNSSIGSDRGSVGGIVGFAKGDINKCYNFESALLSDGADKTGGIVGEVEGDIMNCINTGNVVSLAPGYIGGIAGQQSKSSLGGILYCLNKGQVLSSSSGYAGGIVGYAPDSDISHCGNERSVYITSGFAGGIAGYGWILANDYNTGVISGYAASGICGVIRLGGALRVYNAGFIIGSLFEGAITTWLNGGTVSGAYWRTGSALRAVDINTGGYGVVTTVPMQTMKSSAWAENTLGSPFAYDVLGINEGYPILESLDYYCAPVTSIEFGEGSIDLILGEEYNPAVTIYPVNARDTSVTWSSDDPMVASVSDSGVVTAKAVGEATITAECSGKLAYCTVTVRSIEFIRLTKDSSGEYTICVTKFNNGDFYYQAFSETEQGDLFYLSQDNIDWLHELYDEHVYGETVDIAGLPYKAFMARTKLEYTILTLEVWDVPIDSDEFYGLWMYYTLYEAQLAEAQRLIAQMAGTALYISGLIYQTVVITRATMMMAHEHATVTGTQYAYATNQGAQYTGTHVPGNDFRQGTLLTEHFDDHGAALGYASETEYLNGARNFLNKPPTSTTRTFVTKAGSYFRYDSMTSEFGIINQYGGISTYFMPETGLGYWLEQIVIHAPWEFGG